MKKTKGFYLINIIISLSLFLILLNIGGIYLKYQREKHELKEARIKICEIFTTYRTKALNLNKRYFLSFDYRRKIVTIFTKRDRIIKIIQLPTKLEYITIFDKEVQKIFFAEITPNGNITPSFSVYIFDYKNIARYRISLYGFELIKYFKINIYKNNEDNKVKYDNILKFHKKWAENIKNNEKWEEE